MKLLSASLLLCALTVTSITSVHALDRRCDVTVKGKFQQTVNVDNAFTIGLGDGVTVRSRMGAVCGSKVNVGGNAKQNIRFKCASDIGLGRKVKACKDIGRIGGIGDTSC